MFSLFILLISNPVPIADDKCDLVIYHGDIIASDYPRETPAGFEEDISFTVRNNGAIASGPFTVRLTVTGADTSVINIHCGGLQPGEDQVYDLAWSASWFTPPGEIIIEATADPAEVCDDCWRPNNTGTITKTLFDIYPSEEGWPITPLQVVTKTPLLVNLDSDPELEVVILSGTLLEAFDSDGDSLWCFDTDPLHDGFSPLAADLDGDGSIEIIAMTSSHDIAVFNGDGELIEELELEYYGRLAVADMVPVSGLEMVVSDHETLNLYSWDPGAEEFTWIDSTAFSYPNPPNLMFLLCNDLNGDGYSETVYYCGYRDPFQPPQNPTFYSLVVHDWHNGTTLSERIWFDEDLSLTTPCAGILGGTAEVGFPLRSYDPQPGSDLVPAQLLDPLSLDSILCEKGLVASNGLKFGLFADWRELVPGPDAFIIPAENQCLAWDASGLHLIQGNWPVTYDDTYEYSTSGISPPALGDLDNDGIADVLSSTLRGENGLIVGLNYVGDEPEDIDFPFTLPEGVEVSSGFSIADIDRDGKVEIVFGTDDGFLHCWEFGSCRTGYAPWPQHRHDAGRSGVLE